MRAARLDQILREFRDGLEQIYGSRLIRVVLFGSQARDEAEPDSDIDVMVVLRGPVNPHEEIRRLSVFKAELCLRYDVVVSCVYVSEAEYRQDGTPLMLTVRREGIPV
ncbi:MAG: nucleotidyltransferase domain-containing protein [Bryobacteraceae bacterium]